MVLIRVVLGKRLRGLVIAHAHNVRSSSPRDCTISPRPEESPPGVEIVNTF